MKRLEKSYWICFVWAVYFWPWDLHWSVLKILIVIPVEKTIFSHSKWVPIVAIFLGRMETSVFLLLSALWPHLVWGHAVSTSVTTSMSSYVYQCCCGYKTLSSSESSILSGSSNHSAPLFPIGSLVLREGLKENSTYMTEFSNLSLGQ